MLAKANSECVASRTALALQLREISLLKSVHNLLCVIIYETVLGLVSLGPLGVIKQRSMPVAEHRNALRNALLQARQRCIDMPDSALIVLGIDAALWHQDRFLGLEYTYSTPSRSGSGRTNGAITPSPSVKGNGARGGSGLPLSGIGNRR